MHSPIARTSEASLRVITMFYADAFAMIRVGATDSQSIFGARPSCFRVAERQRS